MRWNIGLKRGDFWTLRQWRFTDGGVCVDFWELFFFAFFLRLSDDHSILPVLSSLHILRLPHFSW
jgi:hypothetical protein